MFNLMISSLGCIPSVLTSNSSRDFFSLIFVNSNIDMCYLYSQQPNSGHVPNISLISQLPEFLACLRISAWHLLYRLSIKYISTLTLSYESTSCMQIAMLFDPVEHRAYTRRVCHSCRLRSNFVWLGP